MVGRTGLTDKQQAALYYARKRRRGGAVPAISLSDFYVPEDAEVGDVIGILSVVDVPDDWGTTTFTIVADADSKHQIDNDDELQVGAALDWETKRTHSVRIRATPDGPYEPIEKTFQTRVQNVVEAPVNVVAPVVTGDTTVAGTLSCTTGEWTDMSLGTYAYQWYLADGDVELTGETDSTLEVIEDYEGEEIYCIVTATNAADSTPEPSNTVGPIEGAPLYTPSLDFQIEANSMYVGQVA